MSAPARGGVNGQIVFQPPIAASVWGFLVCLICVGLTLAFRVVFPEETVQMQL